MKKKVLDYNEETSIDITEVSPNNKTKIISRNVGGQSRKIFK